jgi:hypothetical protein
MTLFEQLEMPADVTISPTDSTTDAAALAAIADPNRYRWRSTRLARSMTSTGTSSICWRT